MIEFICAVYNETAEIDDLVQHVYPFVDRLNFVNDGSTDDTLFKLDTHFLGDDKTFVKTIEHTGLCEIARIHALEMCDDDSWVIMLDADERFAPNSLQRTVDFIKTNPTDITHIYYSQREYIDGKAIAQFAKVKAFKKSAAHLPEIIHRDPSFDGESTNLGGMVIHRKTVQKQIMRELQYLDTYDKLLDEGKVTPSDVSWFKNMHHYVKDRHG